MLVLSRKPSEIIQIGQDIFITVVRIGPNTVRLGITAPRDVYIMRTELLRDTKPPTKLGEEHDD